MTLGKNGPPQDQPCTSMVGKYSILWGDYVTTWTAVIGSDPWRIYFWGQGLTSLRKAGSAASAHEAHQCARPIPDLIRTLLTHSRVANTNVLTE